MRILFVLKTLFYFLLCIHISYLKHKTIAVKNLDHGTAN